jgi:hypothetical protein
MKRIGLLIGIITCIFIFGIWIGGKLSHFGRLPALSTLSDQEQVRLLRGEIIGRALVLYSKEHDGLRPRVLKELAPSYVGTNLNVSDFELFSPNTRIVGPYVIIAQETGERAHSGRLVIRGDGVAYFLFPGD